MVRYPVSSSNVASIGYDVQGQVLEVEFKGGSVYQYAGVPQAKYDEMLMAPSVGKYLNDQIKPTYAATKIQ